MSLMSKNRLSFHFHVVNFSRMMPESDIIKLSEKLTKQLLLMTYFGNIITLAVNIAMRKELISTSSHRAMLSMTKEKSRSASPSVD